MNVSTIQDLVWIRDRRGHLIASDRIAMGSLALVIVIIFAVCGLLLFRAVITSESPGNLVKYSLGVIAWALSLPAIMKLWCRAYTGTRLVLSSSEVCVHKRTLLGWSVVDRGTISKLAMTVVMDRPSVGGEPAAAIAVLSMNDRTVGIVCRGKTVGDLRTRTQDLPIELQEAVRRVDWSRAIQTDLRDQGER